MANGVRKLFDYAIEGVFNSRGEIYVVNKAEALSNAIKIWLATPKGDIVNNPTKGGLLYNFLGVPLTDDNARALQDTIVQGLQQDFEVPLDIRYINVVADKEHRTWQIFAQVYSPVYATTADLDLSVRNYL